MKSYVKRPIVIKALQWDGTKTQLKGEGIWDHIISFGMEKGVWFIAIKTLEGNMMVHKYDYIVKGIEGELYPVKKEIFEKTYREVDDRKEKGERE